MAIFLGRRLPIASSDQPEDRPGTYGPPIWSCSGWGLPSRPVTRPLVRSYRTISPLPGAARASRGCHPPEDKCCGPGRCSFCGTVRRVAPPGCYPAPCPVELGLSSPPACRRSGHPAYWRCHPSTGEARLQECALPVYPGQRAPGRRLGSNQLAAKDLGNWPSFRPPQGLTTSKKEVRYPQSTTSYTFLVIVIMYSLTGIECPELVFLGVVAGWEEPNRCRQEISQGFSHRDVSTLVAVRGGRCHQTGGGGTGVIRRWPGLRRAAMGDRSTGDGGTPAGRLARVALPYPAGPVT